MKKFLFSLCLSLMISNVLASNIILKNNTNYPKKDTPDKIAVQWAISAKEVEKFNKRILNGSKLLSHSLMMLSHNGKIHLSLPYHARYFRVIVWANDKQEPDWLTNWVDITPNKTYIVEQNQLVPRLLLIGAGC